MTRGTNRPDEPEAGPAGLRPPVVGPPEVPPAVTEADVAADEVGEATLDRTTPAPPRPQPTIIGSSQPSAISADLDSDPSTGPAFGRTSGRGQLGDRIFARLAAGSGLFIVVLIALVAVFLIAKAVPAIADDKVNFLTSRAWQVDGDTLRFGILNLLWVTVIISIVAMIIAVPLAIGIALFITQYAPKPLVKPVGYVIDLLAAIPSIIYGIWGIYVLAPKLESVQRFFYHFGAFPLFQNKGISTGSIFNAGVVLSIMVLPIVTAIARDVFERTPRENVEAAWALGATKWEMIRLAVLPYGRPGVISGAMLGLGRALGETIAVTLILSTSFEGAPFSFSIFNNGETFASKIANAAAEFNNPKQTGAYIAAGLVLFVLTFAVNAAARAVVNRRKEFS